MMMTTLLACAGCWNPIGAGAQPIRLYDLQFHEVCAPSCRACRTRLTAEAEDRWSYHGTVISDRSGYMTQPTEFWCDGCRELHERDSTFAQD